MKIFLMCISSQLVLIEAQANGLECVASDTVPRDANVVGNVQYLSLKSDMEKWESAILNAHRKELAELDKKIQLADYDITSAARELTDLYIEFSNRDMMKKLPL